MRSSGAVYRKLKEVKFHHLISLYKRYLRKSPENCRYNAPYQFIDSEEKTQEIRLCLLHQESTSLSDGVYPNLVDVCQALKDCANCNAFVVRYSREQIKELFEKELATKKIKESKYPDICALEWVLEKSCVGTGPINWIQRIYFELKKLILRNKIL